MPANCALIHKFNAMVGSEYFLWRLVSSETAMLLGLDFSFFCSKFLVPMKQTFSIDAGALKVNVHNHVRPLTEPCCLVPSGG